MEEADSDDTDEDMYMNKQHHRDGDEVLEEAEYDEEEDEEEEGENEADHHISIIDSHAEQQYQRS